MITNLVHYFLYLSKPSKKEDRGFSNYTYPQFFDYIRGAQKANNKKYPKGSYYIDNIMFIDLHKN